MLESLNVGHDGGLALAQVYATVESGLIHAFYSSDPNLPPDSAHPEVPSGAIHVADVPTGANTTTGKIDILDVLITAGGDLQVLVNPLTPPREAPSSVSYGYLRQLAVQDFLDGLT